MYSNQYAVKIYTKTGDGGTTSIQGGTRVSKSSQRIITYGAVDEINAALGIPLAFEMEKDLSDILTKIQNELFVVGADLSNSDMRVDSNRVSQSMINCLEAHIDKLEEEVLPLNNFILPGGHILAAHIHHVRTIVRRAEIQAVLLQEKEQINPLCLIYLNRLSDLMFVLGRVVNRRKKYDDVIWNPKKDTL